VAGVTAFASTLDIIGDTVMCIELGRRVQDMRSTTGACARLSLEACARSCERHVRVFRVHIRVVHCLRV
jgi:hypothetical protein